MLPEAKRNPKTGLVEFGDDAPKDGLNVKPCHHCGRKILVRKTGVFRHHLSNEPMYKGAGFTRTCVGSEYPPKREESKEEQG